MREIDPIKRKRTKDIKEKAYLFRINSLGYPVLKNKQISLKNHHYDLIKLPNYISDYSNWKKEVKKDFRIKESDLIYFIQKDSLKSMKELYKNFLLEKENDFSYEETFLLNLEEAIENMVGDSLAVSLFKKGEASLKDFNFSRVYTSKNRHYIRDDLRMGAQIDAWGMMEGTSTLIEIQSLSYEDFHILEDNLKGENLSHKNWSPESQKVFACEAPIFFYKIQMKLLCTGFSQAVIYFVNRNTFDTQAFFIKKDKESFQWLKKIDRAHRKTLSYFLEEKKENWENRLNFHFNINQDFNIEVPYQGFKSNLKQEWSQSIKKEQEEILLKPEKIKEKMKELHKVKEKTKIYQDKKNKLEEILKEVLNCENNYQVGSFLTYLNTRNQLQIRDMSPMNKKIE